MQGVVIGILFSRGSSARLKSLPSDAPDYADPERLAAWLVCECWGAYVAILTGSKAGSVQVLVDPSGLFPAYGTRTAAHNLVVSQPDLIEQVSGARPKPSWHDIQAHLGRSDLRQRSTCLERVREFGRGELTVLEEREAVGISLWSPATFMPDSKSRSCADVAEELQAITTMVVSAWANVLGPVAVAASGGVDSSMICAALAKTRKPFDCITLATADPSGDESAYVEMLSRHLGVRSEVRIYDIEYIDPLRCVSTGLARPTRKPFMAALDSALFEAGQALGSKVIFDGNGGDSLFCFLHSAAPIVDRLLSEGPGRGSVSTFIDMCRLTGCDLPTMTRAVFRRLFRKHGGSIWPPDLRLLATDSEAVENVEPLSPWFNVSVGRHRGKHDHLALILRNQNRLNGLASLPRFSPLMSQPLVEYCLGVPTWLWCAKASTARRHGRRLRRISRATFWCALQRRDPTVFCGNFLRNIDRSIASCCWKECSHAMACSTAIQSSRPSRLTAGQQVRSSTACSISSRPRIGSGHGKADVISHCRLSAGGAPGMAFQRSYCADFAGSQFISPLSQNWNHSVERAYIACRWAG